MKLPARSLLLLLLSLFNSSPAQTIAPPSSSSSHEMKALSPSTAIAGSVRSASPTRQTGAQQQQGEVTKSNWQRHPKIKAARAVFQAVRTGLSTKAFTIRTRKFEYCEPYEDGSRTIATDARGRVRYYEKQAGSDDSALKWEHYYDEAGRLRFVFITGGAANGSQLEHRIYFDEDRKRIWEEQKYTKGEGYTFPSIWPEDQLHFNNASTAFSAKSNCPEIKRKSKVQSPKSRVKTSS
jgi:hypothetical protein